MENKNEEIPFYGREEELSALEELLKRKSNANALIYGRRRVGKTNIISRFIKTHHLQAIIYQCARTSDDDNLASLSSLINRLFPGDGRYFKNLEAIFEFAIEKAQKEPFILVFDEYPYWKEVKTGLDSLMQRCLDQAEGSNLKVILCGSELSMMDELDRENEPLYGRFCLKMKIQPFDYYDAAKFMKSFSNEEKIILYSCFGGLPYLLASINPNISAIDNVKKSFLSPFGTAFGFVETTLKEEVSKVASANLIILAIAKGHHRYSDILSQTHIANNIQMDRALERLISLGIINKEFPINDENTKKKFYYSIGDNAFAFFYKFVFPSLSYLSYMHISSFYQSMIEDELFHSFIPRRFEGICKEYLIRKNKAGKMSPPFFKIGKYYYDSPKEKKNGEFDVVTLDEKGYCSYEVKYRKEKISEAMIRQENNSLMNIPLSSSIRLGFFSKSGYEGKRNKKDGFYQLDDLFE